MRLLTTLFVCLLNIAFAEPERDGDYEVCIQCVKGPRGKKGKQGWPGPEGLTGPQGPNGQNGTDAAWTSLGSFINIYADFRHQGIAGSGVIPMDKIQALSSPDDYIHYSDPLISQITVLQSGVYFITFNIAIEYGENLDNPISVGVFKSGLLEPHCKYFSTVSRTPIIGQCLIPITAGEFIDVRNLSGYDVNLWPTEGVDPVLTAVKASLMMVKVSNSTAMIVDEDIV